jgi:chromosome segregation ATPase
MGTADDRDPAAADVSFAVVRHGFDRTAVRQHLADLVARVDGAEADRVEAQAQAAELQGELEIAKREIAALSERLDWMGAPEGADGVRVLEMARSQAADVTARAKVAAEETWAAAERASAALRDRYQSVLAELEEQHRELSSTHQTIMRSAQEQAEELTTVAERRRRELDEEAERDRIRIDREFSEMMAAKREAFDRELEQRHHAADIEIAEKLRAADEEAIRRVDAVTEQVNRLSIMRDQLTEHLRQTRELIERSSTLLDPLDRDPDPDPEPDPDKPVPPQRAKRTPAKR